MRAPPGRSLRIRNAVEARRLEYIEFVRSLAELETPTDDRASQRPIQDLLSGALDDLGFRTRTVSARVSGGSLLALPRRRSHGSPYQLLLGHTDTVWPRGTLARMPVELRGSKLHGPGVFDMKGGLAHVVMALRVLRELDLEPSVVPVVFFNSDEEKGSRESTRHIRRLARGAARALVLEPALGLEGRIKTARKGVGRFRLRVKGRSAHSGLDPTAGANAIQELALAVQRLHDLTDLDRGLVVNVGEIRGGVSANVVAAEASAEIDVRVVTSEDGRWVEGRIRALRAQVPGCTLEIEGGIGRPPMERTERNRLLWEAARSLAHEMDVSLEEGLAGGGSDGNTTSQTTPTLDGLGAVGDGAHAAHEHLNVDRSLERCALLAGLTLLPDLAE